MDYPGRQHLPEALFEAIDDALFLVDVDSGLTVDCNTRAVTLFEADNPAKLIGILGHHLQKRPFPEEELKTLRAQMVQQGVSSRELQYRTLKGNGFWGLLSARRIHLAKQPYNLVQVKDISRLKHAEAKLADYNQRLEQAVVERTAALQHRDNQLADLAQSIPGALIRYTLHPNGEFSVNYLNPGCESIWEVGARQVAAQPEILWNMVWPEDLPAMQAAVMESARSLKLWSHHWRISTASGLVKWLHGVGQPSREPDGTVHWSTVVLDVSAQKHAEAALRHSEARYRLLAENTADLVCLHDRQGFLRYVSPASQHVLGYLPEHLHHQNPCEYIHPDDLARVQRDLYLPALAGHATRLSYRVRHQSGEYRWLETLAQPVQGDETTSQIQSTSRDISERVAMEAQLRHEALHDGLTGLANRSLLHERLDLAIKRMDRQPQQGFALLFLDLNRFKVINDSLGHQVGDQLLIAVAQCLRGFVREMDLVARISGDEFVILLENLQQLELATHIAQRIAHAFREPFQIAGRRVSTSTSIGIVLGNTGHQNPDEVLRDADIAMYRAKAEGQVYEVFDPTMHAQTLQRINLEHDLRQALHEGALVVYYQPIFRLAEGYASGVEALVRWQHPTQGLLSPDVFIPIAEETGLIADIGLWVLRQACEDMVALAHPQGLRLGVNLSPRQFRHPEQINEILQVLQASGFPPTSLVLELTESMLLSHAYNPLGLLHQLKAHGIKLAIDDFGTGYSCLAYLQDLPMDILKIDRSFVQTLRPGGEDPRLIRMIVSLGRELGLNVVAEGIEDDYQRQRLQELGCSHGQGYWFSPPVPIEELAALLA